MEAALLARCWVGRAGGTRRLDESIWLPFCVLVCTLLLDLSRGAVSPRSYH